MHKHAPLSIDQPAYEDEAPIKDLLQDVTDRSIEDITQNRMLEERIQEALNMLSYREREMIKLSYGFYERKFSHEEIGEIFECSRQNIGQYVKKLLKRLGTITFGLEEFLEE